MCVHSDNLKIVCQNMLVANFFVPTYNYKPEYLVDWN